MSIFDFVHRIRRSAVFWNIATTFLRFGGIILVLPVVVRTIPQAELGLFYVFQALAFLVALLDLGMSPTVGRSVSFIWAGATDLDLSGRQDQSSSTGTPNWPLLADVVKSFSRFYLYLAIVIGGLLSTAGTAYIWHLTSSLPHPTQNRLVWLAFAFGAAVNFAGTLWPVLLGGINRMREMQSIQLTSIGIGYAITLIGLFSGWGLWALAISTIFQGVICRQLARYFFQLHTGFGKERSAGEIRRDLLARIWPMSWRMGMLGLTVYCTLTAPIMFVSYFFGLDAAGSIGLTMQLAYAITQVASAAIVVKAPLFSILHAQGKPLDILAIFSQRLWFYILLFIMGALGMIFVAAWLLETVLHSKTKLPETSVLTILLLYVGIESFQALFRLVCVSINDISFWKRMLIGGGASIVCAVSISSLGLHPFLITLVITKLLFVDAAVIGSGIRNLGGWPLFLRSMKEAPRHLLSRTRAATL